MTAINQAITLTLAQRNSDGFQVPIIVFMAKPSMIPASRAKNGEYRPVKRIIEALNKIAATPMKVLR